ncbi:MAG: hypothetical protein PHH47_06975 [Gallionella sp.]|nr:hypothetical protein [Gallionella sp.]MDD4946670.1 hypothetical protein [Gallionella sp.]
MMPITTMTPSTGQIALYHTDDGLVRLEVALKQAIALSARLIHNKNLSSDESCGILARTTFRNTDKTLRSTRYAAALQTTGFPPARE